MEPADFLTVKSSWNAQGPYDIRICLRCDFLKDEESNRDCNFTESATLSQSPVILSSSPVDSLESSPCSLNISCKSGAEVTSTEIVSNARHVEIHDDSDGYITTVRGDKMTVEDGIEGERSVMYRKELTFDRPLAAYKLKFVSLSDKKYLHLHQIHCTLRKTRATATEAVGLAGCHGNINMDRVREMLSSQQPISERAQSLMDTVEQYQKNQSSVMQDLQEAVINSTTNQKGADVGMMGQMVSLLSSLARPNSAGQAGPVTSSVSPDMMLKMMSSLDTGGDSSNNEDLYGALKLVCRDVTNIRFPCRDNTTNGNNESDSKNRKKKSSQMEERSSEDEKSKEMAPSQSIVEEHLRSYLGNMQETIMTEVEKKLESVQAHFDLRLNRLEAMMTELLASQKKANDDQDLT